MAIKQDIAGLYVGYYNRGADPDGLNFWIGAANGGLSLAAIADDFATQPESTATYAFLAAPNLGSIPLIQAFITEVYQNVFERAPDAPGLAFWTDQLLNGFPPGQMILAIEQGAQGDDKIVLDRKIEVSVYYAEEYALNGDVPWTAAEELGNASHALDGDRAFWLSPNAVALAKANVDQLIIDSFAETFTLTPDADHFVGGPAGDVFNASAQQSGGLPVQTLNDVDTLDGGGGRNVLNAQLVNFFTTPLLLANIQRINLTAPGVALGVGIFSPILDLANANAVDTITFRGLANGAQIDNLQTALDLLDIRDVVQNPLAFFSEFEVNHVGGLENIDDALAINLSNVGWIGGGINPIGIDLDATVGGYEVLNIDSSTLPSWVDVYGSATGTVHTVNITGDADLDINDDDFFSTWDADVLELIDAESFTGDLFTTVTGTGDIEVRSGSGDDEIVVDNVGNALVSGNDGDDLLIAGEDTNATFTGGDGDDTFSFEANAGIGGTTSFDTDDSVDGGAGENVLELQSEGGALLGAGVGPNIVNVQTIRHITDDPISGNDDELDDDLTVNMGLSGSATVLQLFGDYDGFNVEVSNLTNADLVVYDVDDRPGNADIGDLTLSHADPNGVLDTVSLEIRNGSDIDGDLIVPFDALAPFERIEALLLTVHGAVDEFARIAGANDIESNVQISGEGNLWLGANGNGSAANGSYDEENGLVDASAMTGDLVIRLGAENQVMNTGSGDDLVVITTASDVGAGFPWNDLINLSAGGSDTVRFLQITTDDTGSLNGDDYHHINGFDVTDDVIDLDVNNIDLNYTDSGNFVQAGDAVAVIDYVGGTIVDFDGATTNFNFIKFSAGVPTGANNAEDAFELAMGLGFIVVEDPSDDFLMAMYDTTNSQMVLFSAESQFALIPFDNVINADSDIDIVGTVSMSFADYQAFGANNLAFTDIG